MNIYSINSGSLDGISRTGQRGTRNFTRRFFQEAENVTDVLRVVNGRLFLFQRLRDALVVALHSPLSVQLLLLRLFLQLLHPDFVIFLGLLLVLFDAVFLEFNLFLLPQAPDLLHSGLFVPHSEVLLLSDQTSDVRLQLDDCLQALDLTLSYQIPSATSLFVNKLVEAD